MNLQLLNICLFYNITNMKKNRLMDKSHNTSCLARKCRCEYTTSPPSSNPLVIILQKRILETILESMSFILLMTCLTFLKRPLHFHVTKFRSTSYIDLERPELLNCKLGKTPHLKELSDQCYF